MQKKVVSKELYDCLNHLIKFYNKKLIIKKHVIVMYLSKNGWKTEKYKPLNDLSLDDLVELLYNGYQLEGTKEERLLREYNESNSDVCLGISRALKILGIKIEGINN